MNKPSKIISSAVIIVGLTYLVIHTDPVKTDVKKCKYSFTKSRQLFNRLIEQLKNAKHNTVTLKTALRRMDLKPIKSHLDHFNHRLQPELKKIQLTSQKMKK